MNFPKLDAPLRSGSHLDGIVNNHAHIHFIFAHFICKPERSIGNRDRVVQNFSFGSKNQIESLEFRFMRRTIQYILEEKIERFELN